MMPMVIENNTRWMVFFDSEEELIQACATIDIHKYNEACDKGLCSGYQYVTRIARHINSERELSEPQLRQLKRMAKELYKYHNYVQ